MRLRPQSAISLGCVFHLAGTIPVYTWVQGSVLAAFQIKVFAPEIKDHIIALWIMR